MAAARPRSTGLSPARFLLASFARGGGAIKNGAALPMKRSTSTFEGVFGVVGVFGVRGVLGDIPPMGVRGMSEKKAAGDPSGVLDDFGVHWPKTSGTAAPPRILKGSDIARTYRETAVALGYFF
mmetsp:Transcript_85263/g.153550  ORF Transcript_85263/g.153550 Transcript_85263/m.153550 type:complete len:124 (+) Transcript_85263:317-688(+)